MLFRKSEVKQVDHKKGVERAEVAARDLGDMGYVQEKAAAMSKTAVIESAVPRSTSSIGSSRASWRGLQRHDATDGFIRVGLDEILGPATA